MKTMAVVGGGISGLLTAYFAIKAGVRPVIFEKEEAALGGKLRTTMHPLGMMESAANGILADARVENVCADIGVKLVAANKTSRARWIYKNGKPRRWPLGFFETLPLARFMLMKQKYVRDIPPGTTLAQWSERILGRSAARYVLAPAVLGIFGADAESLSARLVMNYFFGASRAARVRGRLRGTVAPEGGMGELIAALRKKIENGGGEFRWEAVGALTEVINSYDHVVVATDARAAGQLLSTVNDARAHALSAVPMVDLISVNAFYAHSAAPYPGFGILFPRGEGVEALGVLQNSFIFSGRSAGDAVSETWIYRGDGRARVNATDADILETLKRDRARVMQKDESPLYVRINRWPQALPLYGPQLEASLAELSGTHNNVHLVGNYMGEIGLNRLFKRADELVNSIT